MKLISGSGGFRIRAANTYSADVPLDSTEKVVSASVVADADSALYIGNDSGGGAKTYHISDIQIEDVTGQNNINPSEYIQADGDGTQGVIYSAYYNRLNNNTVDANGVVTESPGALISPEPYWLHAPDSTNLVEYTSPNSTDWSGTVVWSLDDIGIFQQQIESQEDDNSVSLRNSVLSTSVPANTEPFTVTVYVKKIDIDDGVYPGVKLTLGSSIARIKLNKETGEVTNYGTSISTFTSESAGAYWKVICNLTNDGSTGLEIALYPAISDNMTSDSYSGTVTGKATFDGCQIEQKSFATPPIITSGSTASRDIVQMQHPYSSAYFNQAEGMVVFDWKHLSNCVDWAVSANKQLFGIRSSINSVLVSRVESDSTTRLRSYQDGSNTNIVGPQWLEGQETLVAVRWSAALNELQTGFSADGGVTWSWSSITAYSTFIQNTGIKLLQYIATNEAVSRLKIYNKDKGTQWIETETSKTPTFLGGSVS